MSKGLCASLACRFHIVFNEVGKGESGSMEVVDKDGGIEEVDGDLQEMGEVGGIDLLGEALRPLEKFLGVGLRFFHTIVESIDKIQSLSKRVGKERPLGGFVRKAKG